MTGIIQWNPGCPNFRYLPSRSITARCVGRTIRIPYAKIIRAIGKTLSPDSKKKVENWKEYQQLDDFLDNFYSSSPNEVLNLSKELSSTTKQLKDSLNQVIALREIELRQAKNHLNDKIIKFEEELDEKGLRSFQTLVDTYFYYDLPKKWIGGIISLICFFLF